jgi:Complex I intermediate-associated protein 30 (CIA30)
MYPVYCLLLLGVLSFFSGRIEAFPTTQHFLLGPCSNQQSPTALPMAFGLPDEDRQLFKPEEKASVADETLTSLVAKLDQRSQKEEAKKKENKSMAFLRKIGRVGGAANKDFVNAVGSDEGSTGRQPAADRNSGMGTPTRKSRMAYKECTLSGVIDDLSEPFPITSSGTEWRGITDRVRGGQSNGQLKRETDLQGRPANVLVGHVSLKNGGGFLQMVTDLPLDPSKQFVDASDYDGIELDVLYRKVNSDNNSFNIHLRMPGTLRQASFRYAFQISKQDTWETIRVPFSSFEADEGQEETPLTVDPSRLRRIGLVGLGQEMDIFLAVGGVRFYSVI